MTNANERIFFKGVDKTDEIVSWRKNGRMIDLTFTNGKTYTCSPSKVRFERSALANENTAKRFAFLKDIARTVGLTDSRYGNILLNRYEKIDFLHEDAMLASFLNGTRNKESHIPVTVIFPFGFNASQKNAIDNAMMYGFSVIQGPPGTGKTQTILNIIANAVMNGESVAVVSSNNSATANVQEKLHKYGVDFVSAFLGNSQNKQDFIEAQQPLPDISSWLLSDEKQSELARQAQQLFIELSGMLTKQNTLANQKSERDSLETEYKHFLQFYEKCYSENEIQLILRLSSDKLLELWLSLERIIESDKKIGFWQRLRLKLKYGISAKTLKSTPTDSVIASLQRRYYESKRSELVASIIAIESELSAYNFGDKMNRYSDLSMALFKSKLTEKYDNHKRKLYDLDDLWKHSDDFIKDYPVILSTTYSLRSSLSTKVMYDYVIVDEASQVDLATGALAFSCAKKAVVVGDLKQLPNVVDRQTKIETDVIFAKYDLPEYFRYSNHSLLLSVSEIYSDVPTVLLREHYRCNPKIIQFCNEKFYGGELVILSKPNADCKPLIVYKTAPGNHARDHMNQRQIDVIKNEVIPQQHLDISDGSIGIVTPYRNQTNALQAAFAGTSVKADTVDKFQGQENDVIILSTVDNQISEFADNANRLNVAVSRAKEQLIVVTSADDCESDTNIGDLVKYIEYNNFEVINSQIYSVFDYLYKQYSSKLLEFLAKHEQVSEHVSENVMYGHIRDILMDERFVKYDVAVHVPLKMIIRDTAQLNDEEKRYAMNSWTHVDFLIFDKMGRTPKLIIEVDGVAFHHKGSRQAERDQLKNNILKKYDLPIVRCRTDSSGEREKIVESLT
jgi:superfamily I DNA and/or RNA helicase